MTFANLPIPGYLLLANGHAMAAARVEFAAGGRIGGGGDAAFQYDAVHFHIRIGNRDSAEQRLGIGVERFFENLRLGAVFH